MDRYLNTPLSKETADSLNAGDMVFLSGTIYTARDMAHKRMQDAIDAEKDLPIEIKDAILYYMGPSPAREGKVIGNLYYSVTGNRKKCELFKRRKRMEKDH